jgi:cell wall-associated NlpC family hydrolase
MSPLATQIVKVATSKVGSEEWLYSKSKDNFPENSNKCNKFVYDVMVEAGVQPPPSIPRFLIFSRPPLAGEWADPETAIDGWQVVSDPKPGDVVAEAHNYSDATGHVGIVVADKQTVSASSRVGGKIVQNDWGFRQEDHPTFRRYTR